MAVITATAWTETVEDRNIEGKKKRNRVRLVLSSTQALTYPSSGGIPLPTTLGMVRNVDYVKVIQWPFPASGATGAAKNYHWNYVVSEHSLHAYWETHATSTANPAATGFVELPTTWEVSQLGTAPVMYLEAVGW